MGESFVWKDASGRLGGYLMHRGDGVCCRVDGRGRELTVVLFYGNGAQETYSVVCGTETRWPDGGRELLGGVVLDSGAVCMDTGKAARDAYARRRPRPNVQAKAETHAALSPCEERPKRAEERRFMERRTWPQRRWPPPPCHPQAVYVRGQWREDENDENEVEDD